MNTRRRKGWNGLFVKGLRAANVSERGGLVTKCAAGLQDGSFGSMGIVLRNGRTRTHMSVSVGLLDSVCEGHDLRTWMEFLKRDTATCTPRSSLAGSDLLTVGSV